jgi:Yip1 domain
MKAKLSQPAHESYLKHRKQRTWQIVMPVILACILLIALIVLIYIATFRDHGDVARWAAVSTILMVVPIMVGLFLFLVLLVGIAYLMGRLLGVTPHYTGLAQDYVYRAAAIIKRALDAMVKQIIEMQGVLASIREFFRRIKL